MMHTLRSPLRGLGMLSLVVALFWFNAAPARALNPDPTPPPPAPSGLTLTVASPGFNLSWTDNAGSDYFMVYRSVDAGTYSLLANNVPTASYYDATAANCGVGYRYKVRSVTVDGVSPYSNFIANVVGSCAPAAPTVTAATQQTPSTAQVTWTNNAPGQVTGFSVCRNGVDKLGHGQVCTVVPDPNATSYVYTDLYCSGEAGSQWNGPYDFWVYAVNGGTTSPQSNTMSVSMVCPPPAQPPTLDSVAIYGANYPTFAYNATQIGFTLPAVSTDVQLLRDGVVAFGWPNLPAGSVSGIIDNGLNWDTTYTYTVRATIAGNVLTSNALSVKTGAAPPTLNSVTAISSSSIRLSIQNNSPTANVLFVNRLYTDPVTGIPQGWTRIATLPVNTTSFTDSGPLRIFTNPPGPLTYSNGLFCGIPYSYFINVANTTQTPGVYQNISYQSYPELSATPSCAPPPPGTCQDPNATNFGGPLPCNYPPPPPPGGPAAPTNLTATAISQTQINLSWTDNSTNETGFRIYQNGNLIGSVPANTTTYSVTGLTCNTAYPFYVEAYNANGSSRSNTANATTFACSAQTCQDPNATNYGGPLPCVYGGGTCQDPNATNFGGPLPCTYPQTCQDPNATNFGGPLPCDYSTPPTPPYLPTPNLPSLLNVFSRDDTSLYVNWKDDSTGTDPYTFELQRIKLTPEKNANLTATKNGSAANLAWTNPTTATPYYMSIERSTAASAATRFDVANDPSAKVVSTAPYRPWNGSSFVPQNNWTYADSGLAPGTTYYYRIRACSEISPSYMQMSDGAYRLNEYSKYKPNPVCSAYAYVAVPGSGNPPPPPPPPPPPQGGFQVVSMNPSSGTTNVPVNSSVAVTFSGAVDLTTVNSNSFQVFGMWGGVRQPVQVQGAVAGNGATITYTPSGPFQYGSQYAVMVTTAVKDTQGRSLSQNYTGTFTTATQVGAGQTCQDPNATNFGGPLPCAYGGNSCSTLDTTNETQVAACCRKLSQSNVVGAPTCYRCPNNNTYCFGGGTCQDPTATNFGGALPCTYPMGLRSVPHANASASFIDAVSGLIKSIFTPVKKAEGAALDISPYFVGISSALTQPALLDRNLAPDTVYMYRVRVKYAAGGTGSWTVPRTGKTFATPGTAVTTANAPVCTRNSFCDFTFRSYVNTPGEVSEIQCRNNNDCRVKVGKLRSTFQEK